MANRDLKWFLLIPYKLTFRPPLVYVRKLLSNLGWWLRKWLWIAQTLGGENTAVHHSIEVRGRRDFARHVKLGRGVVFERDCMIWIAEEDGADPRIDLGDGVFVGRNCCLMSYRPLTVGANTIIGAYSYLITGNHRFSDRAVPVRLQGYEGAPITIGRNVWIGCHVVILPGVTIGDNAVIGAGAVVTKTVPSGEIWGGVPARKIGERS